MTVFQFPFEFGEEVYQASCYMIPSPGKQYHITILDVEQAGVYGENHIIVLKGEELQWGIPSAPRGSEFIRAVVTGLKAHPQYQ